MKFTKKSLLSAATLAGAALLAVPTFGGVAQAAASSNNYMIDNTGRDTSQTANDVTGSTSATSHAQVRMEDGYLTLTGVPDLQFGSHIFNAKADTKVNLVNNKINPTTVGTPNDGNDQGILEVIDSRPSSSAQAAGSTSALGYSVTAQLGSFTGGNVNGLSGWELDLKANAKDNGKWDANSAVTTNAEPVVNNAVKLTENGTAQPVIEAAAGQGAGTMRVTYNTADTATLNVPAGASGTYSAPITWVLSAAAYTAK